MPYHLIEPVYDPEVRHLCPCAYPLHPKGCPNWQKRASCPPDAPLLPEVFDLASGAMYVIWSSFNFEAHVAGMRARHPDWSQRQLECCLYWQGTARHRLDEEIVAFRNAQATRMLVSRCPEAMGLNVTATMRKIGIELEWPPRTVTYQVALAGRPNPGSAEPPK
jgi:hypothetical protein